jgi:hypothetical protein
MHNKTGEENELERLAIIFRNAIEKCKNDIFPFYLQCFNFFPKGCCKDASLLLAKYFSDNGFGIFDYFIGIRQNGWSHGWLQKDNIIIDITADQFDDVSEKVIVTTNHSWYLNLHGENYGKANFENYTEEIVVYSFQKVYNLILSKIELN